VPELVENKVIQNSLSLEKDIGLAVEAGWATDALLGLALLAMKFFITS